MKYSRIVLACIIFLLANLIPGNIFSDNIDKADYYYQKYDYKLALDIYEKVYKKKPTMELAQKIANCYRFINNSELTEAAYGRVLSYTGFDPINYKYYADALKQNGKFEEAKANYLLFAQKTTDRKDEAMSLANSADVARMWFENPDQNVKIDNMRFLNSSNSEFSPTAYLAGLVFVSDRWFVKDEKESKSKDVFGWTGNPYLKLYSIPKLDPKSQIAFLDVTLNEEFHNGPAVFTADAKEIYFTRTETPKSTKDKKKENKTTVITKKLFHSIRNGNTWSKPKALPFNSSDYSVQHPALSPDGKILYFASDKPGGFGGMDIYAAKKNADGSWSEAVNCGKNINTIEDDVFPVVRFDGKFYFSSRGHVGMGGLDLFTSDGSYDKFSLAENLKSPLNSTKDDFGIFFNDQKSGYVSSNRKGGLGLDDIYSFVINPTVAKAPVDTVATTPIFAVEGIVVDKATKQPLPNTEIVLVNKVTSEQTSTFSDEEGRFDFNLNAETDYVISGNRERYYSRKEGTLSTVGLKESTIFNVRFELERSENTYIVKLQNIYYDFDKYNIRPSSYSNLNKVVAFLNKVSSSKIQLRSHTDSRGVAIYNQWLSQKRAESAVAYLINKGVASNRLSAVGLGETELLNKCSDGIKCSREQHQLNRRTEFKIQKVSTTTPENTTPAVVTMLSKVNKR